MFSTFKTRALLGAGLFVFCGSLLAADPAYYVKKGTWQETMLAAREGLSAEEAGALASGKDAKATASERLGVWYFIGPFEKAGKNAFTEAFPPEQELETTRSYGSLKWQAAPQWRDGQAHDLQVPANAAMYLFRVIRVSAPKTLTAYCGSDDGMALWLNGKKLISNDASRGVVTNQDTAKLELSAGENKLLFKIVNHGGQCGFYFSTSPNAGGGAANTGNAAREALWGLVQRDFGDATSVRQMTWERQDGIWATDWPAGDCGVLAARYATASGRSAKEAQAAAKGVKEPKDLARVRDRYYRTKIVQVAIAKLKEGSPKALRLAINDLMTTYGPKYPKGSEYLRRLDEIENALSAPADADQTAKAAEQFAALHQEALLANPLLNFERLLLVRRKANQLGLPQNWQGNCALPRNGYEDEIQVLSPVRPEGKRTTLFKPEGGRFAGDVDLNFDADKMLFSSTDKNNRWQIFEIDANGKNLRQVTPGDQNDVDNYDPCYLPNGKIIFGSTACFHGVPCVGGGNQVANHFLMDADGRNLRQLCFDQDHNWCPAVLNNGRVLYTRWEYSDSPHYFTRVLFSMNPDGTQQMEYYGSNSYWPNSFFYARAIPDHPTKVVAVISGHHGVPRMGELVIFDPGVGRHENKGVVQRIPGYGKEVPATIADGLVDGSWPKFLHPYPLSEKYFLVSCQPSPPHPWGIYLVDIYDNMLPIQEEPGYALFEPVPFRKTPRPPVIPDKVDLERKDAVVYMADVYRGGGLRDVPRGTVKSLRLYEFHFAYNQMGGHINIGIDGPWDVHRIMGTVPVHDDGSAMFRVPANTPIAVQPLDGEGKALQVMRSWLTAMPGEVLSCVGCHEQQNSTVDNRRAMAAVNPPVDVTPWYGPTRGHGFLREVQPVLDKYCIGCHNGASRPDGKVLPDLRADGKQTWRNFTPSYVALHPYVRRPGPESDYHMMPPLEYHADTSELIQMLRKGHHNVKLDREAWDRLYTWIDLNVPDKGTWSEHRQIAANMHERRLAMRKLYAGIDADPEAIPQVKAEPTKTILPEPERRAPARAVACPGWPFDAAQAKERQAAAAGASGVAPLPPQGGIDLGEGVKMDMAIIPPGEFVMGDGEGFADERPLTRVKIDKPFYMGKFEITNQQYALFDPLHDSGYMSVYNKDQSTRGQSISRGTQPVIRVSWQRAMAFCRWLGAKTGKEFTLPTEAQWEYACRAGTATPLYYGDVNTDFGKFANMADQRVNDLTRGDSPRWIPSIANVNDGAVVTENVGKYAPNAWGLHDMHGNVWEWTRSTCRAYPYVDTDGRNNAGENERKVCRGGSFYDRPKRCRSAMRLDYPTWQGVYSVGFRVVCAADNKSVVMADKK